MAKRNTKPGACVMANREDCMRMFGEITTGLSDLKQNMADAKESAKRIEGKLIGNGAPGLCTRVDRLEQVGAQNKWWLRTIGAAAIAAVTGVVVGLFRGHQSG